MANYILMGFKAPNSPYGPYPAYGSTAETSDDAIRRAEEWLSEDIRNEVVLIVDARTEGDSFRLNVWNPKL